jgi:hypothetical protein
VLSLDGVDDYLSIPKNDGDNLVGHDWAWEAWIWDGKANNGGVNGLFSEFATVDKGVKIRTQNGVGARQLNVLLFCTTSNAGVTTGNVIPTGQWTHIVVTWQVSALRLTVYVNGVPVGTGMGTGNVVASTGANRRIGHADAGTYGQGRVGLLDIHQAVSITYNFDGKDISHLENLSETVKCISDDGKGVYDSAVMLRAMETAAKKKLVVKAHEEDYKIVSISDRLSENLMTARDVALAKHTGCHLHVCHVSTKEAMDEIVRAKIAGYKIPKYINFVEEFPLTASGKIQKFKLREIGIKEYGLEKAANITTA